MKKRAVYGAVLAAVLVFAAWMLWPRPLVEAFDTEQPFTVHVMTFGAREGQAFINTAEPLTVEPGTPEAAAVRQVLAKQSWHLCLETLVRADALEGLGDMRISLYGRDGAELSVFSGNSRISCDGRYVRLGYWGKARSAALCEELLAALRME